MHSDRNLITDLKKKHIDLPVKTGSITEKAAKTSNEDIIKKMIICQEPNPPALSMILSKLISLTSHSGKVNE